MKTPIIIFEDFSFQYDAQAKPTLKNINLTIYEGEKVLIVGPSGSGKSTLSNCINGLVPFNYKGEIKGSLKVYSKETQKTSVFEISEHVGTVLQDPDGQFIGLTVGEDIAFRLENEEFAVETMKKKVKGAAELVDIASHLQEAPHQLSGGQKQRVTLAGVLVGDVEILLFDEPLASLDPAAGKMAIELIDHLHQETQKTIVIIEHRLEDVLHAPVDRIIVMNEGEIVADTTPGELLNSSLLEETGIREPLYITALKYAGCDLNKVGQLENIKEIETAACEEKLKEWLREQVQKDEEPIQKEVLLSFENVHFGYHKEKMILKDVSFEVYKGEMLSIVGKNGAGKSTLSKLIGGFYLPTKGRITLGGKDLKEATIKERSEKIGIVLQNPNQMLSKSMIFDEVAMGLRARGVKEDEVKERVDETLKICGLYPFRNWPISALSYGQKKRVSVAAILVLKPEIILLDEPTAGQDYKHYTEMMQFLKRLNEKGTTIIMITHDMHLMLEYTDRAIVLADGQKLADAKAFEVLTTPELAAAAHLKETSLYELALRMHIEEPRIFVKAFISAERREKICQKPC